MSHKKIWKEIRYIKNDQSRDLQSSLSESQSIQSSRFTQVRFKKSKIQKQKTSKILALTNSGSRISKFNGERSFLQESNRMKENQIAKNQHKELLKMRMKTSSNCDSEINVKSFVYDIKKIHQDIKIVVENILMSFQKMKSELEANLLLLFDQLLKQGKNISHIQKFNQVFDKKFVEIKNNISILPKSLTKLRKKCELEQKLAEKDVSFDLQSLLLLFEHQNSQIRLREAISGEKSLKKIVTNFNFDNKEESKIRKDNQNIELPLTSHQKLRNQPLTQRHQHLRSTSFEQQIIPFSGRQNSIIDNQLNQNETEKDKGNQFNQVNKINDIIFHMRIILNQSR